MGGHLSRPESQVASLKILAIAGLVALPFVFPLSAGPSPSAWQLLASWLSIALLLFIACAAPPAAGIRLWLAAVAAATLVAQRGSFELWVPVGAALGALYLATCVGVGLRQATTGGKSALAWALFAAGVLSSLLGLLQYYGLATPLVPWTQAPEIGLAYGNLRQRNQFATLVAMALVAALWLHAAGGRRVRSVLLPASLMLILGLAASTSRTGLLQLLLISGTSALLAWRERRMPTDAMAGTRCLPSPWLLIALIPVYFVATWLLPLFAGADVQTMAHRLRDGASMAHSRLVLWHNVLDLIAQRPWTGWGWGELAFAHYSTLYDGLRFAEILDNAHNLPLHLAVELGIPAALVICSGFGWLVLAARPWRETDPARLMAWGVLAMIVLHSLLEYPLWYGPFQLVFGLCLGFLWPSSPSGGERRPSTFTRPLAASMLLAAVAYAAWDYTRISQIYLPREERLPVWQDDTLVKAQNSWLFANQVKFAELALTSVNADNAAEVHALALQLLHFSPEPRVIAKLIDSAVLLGRNDEASAHMTRFRIAFPREYERWRNNQPIDDPSD